MIKWNSDNEYRKDMRSNDIGLCTQNTRTILSSSLNTFRKTDTLWPFDDHVNLHFNNEQVIHTSSNSHKKSGYDPRYGFASHLVIKPQVL
jgi:hypothetical protein